MIGYKKTDKHKYQPHGFGFNIRARPTEVMIIPPLEYEDNDFLKQRKKEYAEREAKRPKDGLIDMNSILDKNRN